MHYFQFQIKEWVSNTSHLSHEEESIYLRLINYYYDSERPICIDDLNTIMRKLRIRNYELTLTILDEFFTLSDWGNSKAYYHKRCDEELARYHSMAEAGKRGAEKRWGNAKPIAPLLGGDGDPNHPPMLIINKELKIKNKELTKPVDPPYGVSSDLWSDFLVYRKRMKSPVTPRVLARLIKEADLAKMPLSEVLETIIFKGWKSFDATWVVQKTGATPPKNNQAWRTNDSLMMAKAVELGLSTVGLQRYDIINKIDATLRSRGL